MEKQETGSKRNRSPTNKEQYYTNNVVALLCVKTLASIGYIFDVIIDPSSGAGAFLPHLRQFFPSAVVKAYDIDPKAPDIKKRDFLQESPIKYTTKYEYETIAVCSNPPFGSHSKKVRQFFSVAAQFASVIAFVMPPSFGKPTMQNLLPKNWHLVKEIDLPDNAYEVNGEPYHVSTIFQVWEHDPKHQRVKKTDIVPIHFRYVTKGEAIKHNIHTDIAIQQTGANAGRATPSYIRIMENIERHQNPKMENSYWFSSSLFCCSDVNQSDDDTECPVVDVDNCRQRFCDRFNQFDWPTAKKTVAQRSIGKQEMTERIDQVLEELFCCSPRVNKKHKISK